MSETAKDTATIALIIVAVAVLAAVPALREPVFTWVASTVTTVFAGIGSTASTVLSWFA